jgi:nitrite reductase (NADH) small subunit
MQGTRVALAQTEEFQTGVCRVFTVGHLEVGVIRLASGRFTAVLNRCPHKGAPICKGTIGGTWPPCDPGKLAFAHDGEILTCPWHGREFDLNTGCEVYQARPGRLRVFPVEIEEGTVTVLL